ncbi:MAG TPA: hypothetical protein VGM18_05205 [Candidatus Sulfotelmatobacter sp.]|jgi:hypothetical protein
MAAKQMQGSFDCIVARFARDDFLQDDKTHRLRRGTYREIAQLP